MRRTVSVICSFLLFLPLVTLNAGCDDELMKQFRSAASDGIADGLKTILDSIVDGLFEVIEPDDAGQTSAN